MSKSDYKYVNFSEDYELSYVLHKMGYSVSKDTINWLRDLRDKALIWCNKLSYYDLTHDELFDYLHDNHKKGISFTMDHKYVNFSENYELDYVLRKMGYKQTDDNRKWLKSVKNEVLSLTNNNSSRVTHDELFIYLEIHEALNFA